MRDLKNEINNTNSKHLTKDTLSKVVIINGKPKCICDKCVNPKLNEFAKNTKIQK